MCLRQLLLRCSERLDPDRVAEPMATILVADDHPLNRHFLATLLSYHGHVIHEAADGQEALESLRQHRPDLIIADVVMPRMDGFSFVRALRSEPKFANIPVIFYTASYRESESRAIAAAAGVEHVITKPSDPALILETVQKALKSPEPVRRRGSSEQLKNYAERLQVASIRMSALIELGLELHGERDPDRLIRTACRAVRTIFGATSAAIMLMENGQQPRWWSEGEIREIGLEELRGRTDLFSGRSVRNVSGAENDLVRDMALTMPGVAAVLLLPMTAESGLYGWIVLGRKSPAFSIDDERLGLSAASEIQLAHENVRLFRAQRERATTLSAEIDVSREDLAALVEVSPVSISAFDQNRIARAWNATAERIFGWRADEVLGHRDPTIPPDLISEYERLSEKCLRGTMLADVEVQRMKRDGTRIDVSVSMAPLRDGQGLARGFVCILNDVTDRKRNGTELRSSRERLRALSARVLSIQEDERTRIARELHDDLAQLLAAIKIDASRLVQDISSGATSPARVVDGIVPLIDATLDAIVRIVSELRPSRIGDIGLVAAIEKKLDEFQLRTDIECELSIRPENLHISDDIAAAVFRILEEALTNITRHSGATRAEVRLRHQGDEFLLEVRDNGRGIRDAEKLAENSYGIIGMTERAYLFGGSLTITGVEGRGTIVAARIPANGRHVEEAE